MADKKEKRKGKGLAEGVSAAETDRLEKSYGKVDVSTRDTDKVDLLLQIAQQESTVIRLFFLEKAAMASANTFIEKANLCPILFPLCLGHIKNAKRFLQKIVCKRGEQKKAAFFTQKLEWSHKITFSAAHCPQKQKI